VDWSQHVQAVVPRFEDWDIIHGVANNGSIGRARTGWKSDPARFSENVGPEAEAGVAEQPSSMVAFL
jgi:hypothetical protein